MPTLNPKTIIFIAIAILCMGCGGGANEAETGLQDSTSEVLEGNKINLTSYKRNGDLLEELYQELVEKNAALKQLENDLEANQQAQKEPLANFEAYDAKSQSYYHLSKQLATGIADSLLRIKLLALIENSQKNYGQKTPGLQDLLKQISNNDGKIKDQHAVLKVVLTLPVMEKYQEANLPSKQPLKDVINLQQKLINRIDSLTPQN